MVKLYTGSKKVKKINKIKKKILFKSVLFKLKKLEV